MKSAKCKVKGGRRRIDCGAEDRLDIAAAKKALAESAKLIPYETVRKELGLKRRPVRPDETDGLLAAPRVKYCDPRNSAGTH